MHGFFGHKGDTTSIFATPLSSPLCFFPVSGRSKDTAQMLKYKKRENLTFDFVEFGCTNERKKNFFKKGFSKTTPALKVGVVSKVKTKT